MPSDESTAHSFFSLHFFVFSFYSRRLYSATGGCFIVCLMNAHFHISWHAQCSGAKVCRFADGRHFGLRVWSQHEYRHEDDRSCRRRRWRGEEPRKEDLRCLHQDCQRRHHPLPRLDRPLLRHCPSEPRRLQLVLDRVLHRRPCRSHAFHGHHPHSPGLRRRRLQARPRHHAVPSLLRHDARPRPRPRQGLQRRSRPPRRYGPRRLHQRRSGLKPVHVHCQGQRCSVRPHDDRHHRRCHLHDPPPL